MSFRHVTHSDRRLRRHRRAVHRGRKYKADADSATASKRDEHAAIATIEPQAPARSRSQIRIAVPLDGNHFPGPDMLCHAFPDEIPPIAATVFHKLPTVN
jgi:hypothetical protein